MSITAKEKDNNKPKEKFPTNDRDYYYYYEVSQLIQLKNYYNSINSLILADKLENSVLNKDNSKNKICQTANDFSNIFSNQISQKTNSANTPETVSLI